MFTPNSACKSWGWRSSFPISPVERAEAIVMDEEAVQHPHWRLQRTREVRNVHLNDFLSHSKPRGDCNAKSSHLREQGWVKSLHCALTMGRGSRCNSHGGRTNLASTRSPRCLDGWLVAHLKDCMSPARLVNQAVELRERVSDHALGEKDHSHRHLRPKLPHCEDNGSLVAVTAKFEEGGVHLNDWKPTGSRSARAPSALRPSTHGTPSSVRKLGQLVSLEFQIGRLRW